MSSGLLQTSVQWHKDGPLPYLYRTLDRPSKEIRLLEVLPGSKEEPLRASFVSGFLSDDHIVPYETISYAWGEPTQRGEIEIEESVIDIPASSAAALRCMRRPDISRRLWIDAVCINQDDDLERSSQVKIMGEIYRRSSHNLVYLGDEDASTKSAMVSIKRALEELQTRLEMSENFEEILKRKGTPMKCEVDVAAINQFFQRPWFRSVTTIITCLRHLQGTLTGGVNDEIYPVICSTLEKMLKMLQPNVDRSRSRLRPRQHLLL